MSVTEDIHYDLRDYKEIPVIGIVYYAQGIHVGDDVEVIPLRRVGRVVGISADCEFSEGFVFWVLYDTQDLRPQGFTRKGIMKTTQSECGRF